MVLENIDLGPTKLDCNIFVAFYNLRARRGKSKWTACHPREKEKHFLVVRRLPVDGPVKTVVLEAVLTGSEYEIPWRELRDTEVWKAGWQ